MGWFRHFTRGCTLFPDENYTSCCDSHDKHYATGTSRSQADQELRECIIKAGHPYMAWIAWIGIRLFGWPFWYLGHKK